LCVAPLFVLARSPGKVKRTPSLLQQPLVILQSQPLVILQSQPWFTFTHIEYIYQTWTCAINFGS